MKIKSIQAYEILASGGYPSIECKVELESGAVGIASVPYGASAGSREAAVLNDEDNSRYKGKGMLKAVENVNTKISPELIDKNAEDQVTIDKIMIELDGSENKSNLGGNSILAVSLAVAKAAASEMKKPLYEYIRDVFNTGVDFSRLPNPMVVSIEGGKHAHNTTDLQEYCITGISDGGPTANIRKCLESYHSLKKILQNEGLSTNVGNEGAFAPSGIKSNEAPFEYILKAIEDAGYIAGEDLGISVDAAASEFFHNNKYELKIDGKSLSSEELVEYYKEWIEKYPIVSLEDMLHEDDWENWTKLNQILTDRGIYHVGDDLTVTNKKILQKAIDQKAINAILIKLNQIGSLTETVQTCLLAKESGMITVPSHRGGGETNDTSMVDLAVAVGGKFIKVGPTRGERIAKYNRLMEIERELLIRN